MFGLVLDEALYLKADAENAIDFQKLNLRQFEYARQGDLSLFPTTKHRMLFSRIRARPLYGRAVHLRRHFAQMHQSRKGGAVVDFFQGLLSPVCLSVAAFRFCVVELLGMVA